MSVFSFATIAIVVVQRITKQFVLYCKILLSVDGSYFNIMAIKACRICTVPVEFSKNVAFNYIGSIVSLANFPDDGFQNSSKDLRIASLMSYSPTSRSASDGRSPITKKLKGMLYFGVSLRDMRTMVAVFLTGSTDNTHP